MRLNKNPFAMWQLVICMQIFSFFYFQGNRRGSTQLSKCYDCEGNIHLEFLFCNLFAIFLYFCFCKWSLAFVWVRHDKSRNMYIKSSYVQILSLVSYMLRLFFQKITWIYANWDKIKMYRIKYWMCIVPCTAFV